ncbi:MAG: TetR/AcrR family transcriptional regulator [Peptococcaceae bacterium]|jgi:AcrR family transcriptional regulator|nr:TetR/AcrR family transcriptional regulator [Peptococcaceae bacterium]
MPKQNDLRVIRTKKMIKDAFIDLIEAIGYESITIQDIAQRALINRKTFYAHYDGKSALFDEISWELLRELAKGTQMHAGEGIAYDSPEDLRQDLEIVFNNVNENRRWFCILFGEQSSDDRSAKLVGLFKQICQNKVLRNNKNKPSIPHELLVQFFASTLLVVFKWWISQSVYNARTGSNYFLQLFRCSFAEIVGVDPER